MRDLSLQFCGVRFQNPIIAASTDMSRTSERFEELLHSGVGGIITKSVTDAAALQSAGIARFDIRDIKQNKVRGTIPDSYVFFSRGGSMVSMETFAAYAPQQLKWAKEQGVVLIGSISASRLENWVDYAVSMEQMGFPMLELNFGNPHGEAADGKLGFLIGQSPELSCEIVKAIRAKVKIPMIVKLTPQVSDMVTLAKALESAGAQAVTVMHRYQGLVVDVDTEEIALGGYAAIGGPWMKPISLANIAKVYRQTGLAVCGGNGADNGRDVAEYLMCGAGLVQIGSTLMLRGPEAVSEILQEFTEIAERKIKNGDSIETLRGRLADRIVTYKSLGDLPARRSELAYERCQDCLDHICVRRCYFGALADGKASIVKDDDRCTGCGMCLHVCPSGAVTMKEEGNNGQV